jgi:hypothetical protein
MIYYADEPKYLLVRLLLRKTNKIFSRNELKIRYSSELGHHLQTAMQELIKPLGLNEEDGMGIKALPNEQDSTPAERMNGFFSADELRSISNPSPCYKEMVGNAEAGPSNYRDRRMALEVLEIQNAKSWKDVSSGMTVEEEMKEPELAKALKISAWEAIQATSKSSTKKETSPPTTPNKSGSISPAKGKAKESTDDFYKMKEGSTDDITAFARGDQDMEVEEIIKYLGMAELSTIAKELKCWKSKYSVS